MIEYKNLSSTVCYVAYNKTKKKLSDDQYIYLKYTAIKRKPLPKDTHTNTQKETKKPPYLNENFAKPKQI